MMKIRVWIVFISALLLLGRGGPYLFSQAVEERSRERLRLVHADNFVGSIVDGKKVQEFLGRVRLIQGEAKIFCDRARWWEKDDKALLSGRVMIYDGKRTLRADSVRYDGKSKVETAWGCVSLETGSRKLTADRLKYAQEQELAFAEGNAVLSDFKEKVTLEGERVVYDRGSDYGIVEGRPQLVKVDSSSGERMVVNGLKIESWGGEQRVLVSDSVRIEKDDWKAVCQSAEYHSEEELLFLEQTPVVWYRDQEMRGDTIDIQLKGVQFREGVIRGKAQIVSRDSTFEDILKGQHITIEAYYTNEDTIQKVIVKGQASSLYHIFDEEEKEQGINSVTGDRIVLTFIGDHLERVKVESDPGQSTGIFTPKEKEMHVGAEEKKL